MLFMVLVLFAVVLSAVAIVGVLFWKIKPQSTGEVDGLKAHLADCSNSLKLAQEKLLAKEHDYNNLHAEAASLRATCAAITDKVKTLENALAHEKSDCSSLQERLSLVLPSVERAKAEKKAAEDAKITSDQLSNLAHQQVKELQGRVDQLTPSVEKANAERSAAEVSHQDVVKRLTASDQKYAALLSSHKVDVERAATAEQKVEGIQAHNDNMHRTIEALTQERSDLQQQLSDALAKQQADKDAALNFESISQRVLKDAMEDAKGGMEALHSLHQQANRAELEKHAEKLTQTLDPLQNKLKEYDAAVNALKLNTQEVYGGLKAQMLDLKDAERALHDQARALTTALSAGPKVRGTYGEIILRQLVEFVGMQMHCHFETQASRETEEGRRIPDMVISLPGGQKVIVDSKAVMSACTEAYCATEESQRALFLRKHCENVRSRVVDLSAKNYFANHADAVEAVVLFLPAENLYAAAMENDPDLTEFAISRNIILCGPNSLIMLLKVSNQIWRRASIEQEAMQIAQTGSEIYKISCDFLEKYARVGNKIKQLQAEYNDALGTLDGRLIPKSRNMANLKAIASNKAIEDILPVKDDLHEYRSAEGKKANQEVAQPPLLISQ
jgi:DNA recombination protein RmuC